MERWDDLRYMLAVKKAGTMSGAARLLGANVGTVSRRIERLGSDLGVQPFLKTPDGWQPNPAMDGLIEAAVDFENRITVELNRGDSVSTPRAKSLKIDCPPMISSLFLFPGLATLRKTAPEIVLTVTNTVFNQTLGDSDLIITSTLPERGRLMTRKVGSVAFGLFHSEGSEPGSDWLGLLQERDEAQPIAVAHEFFRRQPVMRLENFYFLAEAMKSTGLSGPLPDLLARRNGGFVRLGTAAQRCKVDMYVCYHETRKGDHALETLIDWIDTCFRNEGWTT